MRPPLSSPQRISLCHPERSGYGSSTVKATRCLASGRARAGGGAGQIREPRATKASEVLPAAARAQIDEHREAWPPPAEPRDEAVTV